MIVVSSGNKEFGWLVSVYDGNRYRSYTLNTQTKNLAEEIATKNFNEELQYKPEDNLCNCAEAIIELQKQWNKLFDKFNTLEPIVNSKPRSHKPKD
jgi:hypothetical protein